MTEEEPSNLGEFSQNLFWIILLIGGIVHIPITLPGTEIRAQPAAFDILLPCLVLWGLWRGKITPPSRTLLFAGITAVIAVAIHSATVSISDDPLLMARLIKESLKLVLIIIHFVLLLILFGHNASFVPSARTVLIILAISCPIVIFIARYEPIPATRTVYAAYLVGLLFFLVLEGEWRHRVRSKICLITAGLTVLTTSLILHSKGMAGLATAIVFWAILEPVASPRSILKVFLTGAAMIFVISSGVLAAAYLSTKIELLQHMDSIERSIGIRVELWSLALARLLETFPVGIGLGQFPLAAKTVPILALEGHNYVHNTFLGLALELGLIGVLLGSMTTLVLIFATCGWPLHTAPVFLIFVLPPLLIHDGHSIRILLLITALGLARFIQKKRNLR